MNVDGLLGVGRYMSSTRSAFASFLLIIPLAESHPPRGQMIEANEKAGCTIDSLGRAVTSKLIQTYPPGPTSLWKPKLSHSLPPWGHEHPIIFPGHRTSVRRQSGTNMIDTTILYGVVRQESKQSCFCKRYFPSFPVTPPSPNQF